MAREGAEFEMTFLLEIPQDEDVSIRNLALTFFSEAVTSRDS
jgi:hypothetical protein